MEGCLYGNLKPTELKLAARKKEKKTVSKKKVKRTPRMVFSFSLISHRTKVIV